MLRMVVLNGGRGAASLIPSLLDCEGLHVTSIVNAYDDGKSTGQIRRFFGMLGPSDIRKVQELMLPLSDGDSGAFRKLFRHRYPDGADRGQVLRELEAFADGTSDEVAGVLISNRYVRDRLRQYVGEFLASLSLIEKVQGETFGFGDCSIMNCIYAGAFLACRRNIDMATLEIDRLFKLRGVVLPTSNEDKQLVALRENGEMLYCEADIVELRSNVRVERIYILDRAPDRERFEQFGIGERRAYLESHHCFVGITPAAELALKEADIVVYAPGTQHSSLYPTYLTTGVARTIADNRQALKIFITNIGADYETPSYRTSDYLRGALRYLNLSEDRDFAPRELVDLVMVNSGRRKADETYVAFDPEGYDGLDIPIHLDDLEAAARPGTHDGSKIAELIMQLYENHDRSASRA